MTLVYAAERRLRPKRHEPLDYDDSLVPGQIVAGIMHLANVTDRQGRMKLGLRVALELRLSSSGSEHGPPRRCIGEPWRAPRSARNAA